MKLTSGLSKTGLHNNKTVKCGRLLLQGCCLGNKIISSCKLLNASTLHPITHSVLSKAKIIKRFFYFLRKKKKKQGKDEERNKLIHTETLHLVQIHLEHAQYTWQLGPATTWNATAENEVFEGSAVSLRPVKNPDKTWREKHEAAMFTCLMFPGTFPLAPFLILPSIEGCLKRQSGDVKEHGLWR